MRCGLRDGVGEEELAERLPLDAQHDRRLARDRRRRARLGADERALAEVLAVHALLEHADVGLVGQREVDAPLADDVERAARVALREHLVARVEDLATTPASSASN